MGKKRLSHLRGNNSHPGAETCEIKANLGKCGIDFLRFLGGAAFPSSRGSRLGMAYGEAERLGVGDSWKVDMGADSLRMLSVNPTHEAVRKALPL